MVQKNRILIFILLMCVLVAALAGCSTPPDENDDETPPMGTKYTVEQTMDRIRDGLNAGGNALSASSRYAYKSEYSIITSLVNYTITFLANYAENEQDSEIFIKVLDNNKNTIERVVLYYDGENLFIRTQKEKTEENQIISKFSSSPMFDMFFTAVRLLDTSSIFFGPEAATFFDRTGVNLNYIGYLTSQNNIDNASVGENRDSLEVFGLDLTIIRDTVNSQIAAYYNRIGKKFNVLTNEILGFELSRVLEYKFAYIYLTRLNVRRVGNTADYFELKLDGKFSSYGDFTITAKVEYDLTGTVAMDEGRNYQKNKFQEVNLGQRSYDGTLYIPSVSEDVFDVTLDTDINTENNLKNKLAFRSRDAGGNQFLDIYYKDGIFYLDATGINDFLNGTIDISAFNLPKVFLSNINLASYIKMFYNDGVKIISTLGGEVTGVDVDDELYDLLIDNFESEGRTIRYTVTAELLEKLYNWDKPEEEHKTISTIIAEVLEVEEERLMSILGEDFFDTMEIIISYNFGTEEIGITFRQGGELIFHLMLKETKLRKIEFPLDTNIDNSTYGEFILPDHVKIELDIVFNVQNTREFSDLSKFLGALIGDPSGFNTTYLLQRNTNVRLVGAVCESYSLDAKGSTVTTTTYRFSLHGSKDVIDDSTLLLSIFTDKNDTTSLLIDYRLPLGSEGTVYTGGIKYRIPRQTVSAAYNETIGEDNIFNTDSVFAILEYLFGVKSSRAEVNKNDGWFTFNLMAETNGEDPVRDLTGIEGLSAAVRARIQFTVLDFSDVNSADYRAPRLNDLANVTVNSLYDYGSKWREEVEYYINGIRIPIRPAYIEETITTRPGVQNYSPVAWAFAQEITYRLIVLTLEGTYEIDYLVTDHIVIDPAFTKTLPPTVSVVFNDENATSGEMAANFIGFSEVNITHAGYNLSNFDGKFVTVYRLLIGENSILEKYFDVYITVANRRVVTPIENDLETKGVPVVGEIVIDPYTYALRKLDNPEFDPILYGIDTQSMMLRFYNVYGTDIETDTDLAYDIPGVNWFYLRDLALNWEFDELQIVYNGNLVYAYAYYGDVKIAIRVLVQAKVVDYIQINNEDNGKYTIDYLVKSSYTIPVQGGIENTVLVYFKSANISTYRIVNSRPSEGVSAEQYYQNYLPVQLLWAGGSLAEIQSKIGIDGTNALFGSNGNTTTASFAIGTVGTQTLSLQVDVPERRELSENMTSKNAIVRYEEQIDNGVLTLKATTSSVFISSAKFFQSDAEYAPLMYDPYGDTVLPDSIFFKVCKDSISKGMIYKEYPVTWMTQNEAGTELNIIVKDEEGKYRLKHPTTNEATLLVYGKIGDGNGTITVKMLIKNIASELESITYEGLAEGQDIITIDPYKPYYLPSYFTATLSSGESITRSGLVWFIRLEGAGSDDIWYPATRPTSGTYNPALYDENGWFVFSRAGEEYTLRYVIEATTSVIRQELFLRVTVSARTIVSGTLEIYNDPSRTASTGLSELNYYLASSQVLLERVKYLLDHPEELVGVYFNEARTSGVLDKYSLRVDFIRASVGDAKYVNSLDRLYEILRNPAGGDDITLLGTVMTGTINEQQIAYRITLADVDVNHLYFANGEGAVREGIIELPELLSNGSLPMTDHIRINLLKPYALKVPDSNGTERYATPYQYFSYYFQSLSLYYDNGMREDVVPVLDFMGHAGNADAFNRQVLGIGVSSPGTTTVIRLLKLSAGSRVEQVEIEIVAVVDTRLTQSDSLVAELFTEDSMEIYTDEYVLPSYIEVVYAYSGRVRYEVPTWIVGSTTRPYLNRENTEGIPVSLIDTLRRRQGSIGTFSFRFGLPYDSGEDVNFFLEVQIPKKDIAESSYSAVATEALYDINDGYLTVSSPYLFYNDSSQYIAYGFDTSKVPSVITAQITDSYTSTAMNRHTVNWVFRENVFTADKIATGILREDKVIIATAELSAYFYTDGNGDPVRQTQTVYLYITVEAMVFSGISYGQLTVENDAYGIANTVVIDPYNDPMNYRGSFLLPKKGMTIYFNNGAASYYVPADEMISYLLLANDGMTELDKNITRIPYNEKGHTLSYDNLRSDKVLELILSFPGYPADASGVKIYVRIMPRIIISADIPNIVLNGQGQHSETLLPALYYIDPYNAYTFSLPTKAEILFEGEVDTAAIAINGWEFYHAATDTWIALENSTYFYSQVSSINGSEYQYGYYKMGSGSYLGGIYSLRGYITQGVSSVGGVIGKQTFEITVIVLNRSLKEEYRASYHYDDPTGGLLSDIPATLYDDMFVAYDNYYAHLSIAEEHYFSAISTAILPTVEWGRYVDNSVIDYTGGFDKSLTGYLSHSNTALTYYYNQYHAETTALYENLIKAYAWDSYFTVSGTTRTPLLRYSTATRKRLSDAADKLEMQVRYQTFLLLAEKYRTSESEVERNLEHYLVNNLLADVKSKSQVVLTDEEASAVLYTNLQTREAEGTLLTGEAVVYSDWLTVYTGYTETVNTNAEKLTGYQVLKIAMYEKAKTDAYFTLAEESYNATLYADIERQFYTAMNARVYDRLYDTAGSLERTRMTQLLSGSTALEKSAALLAFIAEQSKSLYSYGEKASVRITAPTMDFSAIYDDEGQILDTFLFNVYNTVALLLEVEVEFVISNAALYTKLIDRAIDEVFLEYMEGNAEAMLSAYQKFIKYQIIESIFPEGYGEFDYDAYLAMTIGVKQYQVFHFEELYQYLEAQAVSHIPTTGDARIIWDNLYGAHEILSNAEMMLLMNGILQAVNADNSIIDKYGEALTQYKTALKSIATAELSEAYDTSEKLAKAAEIITILASPAIVNSTQATVFSLMYSPYIGTLEIEGAYYYLYHSLSSAEQNIINTQYLQSGTYAATYNYFVHYAGAEPNTLTVQKRAKEILNMMIGVADAYDALYADPTVIGESKTSLDDLLSGINVNLATGYNNAISEMQFLRLKKARIFMSLYQEYYVNAPQARAALLAIYNNSLKEVHAAAYDRVYAEVGTTGRDTLDQRMGSRTANGRMDTLVETAFIRLLNSYIAKAEKKVAEITSLYTQPAESTIYQKAKQIVENLKANDQFVYRGGLTVSAERQNILKGEAVAYYYQTQATDQEKLMIETVGAAYGFTNQAGTVTATFTLYNVLSERYAYTELAKNLEGCYYLRLLAYFETATIAAITADIAGQFEAASNDDERAAILPTYKTLLTAYTNKFITVANGGALLNDALNASVKNAAYRDALAAYIAEELVRYYNEWDVVLAQYTKTFHREAFFTLYAGAKGEMQTLAEALYAADSTKNLRKLAYERLTDILLTEAESALSLATESVLDEQSKAAAFDAVRLEDNDSKTAKEDYEALSALYLSRLQTADTATQAAMNNVVSSSVFLRTSQFEEGISDILFVYSRIKDGSYSSAVQAAFNDILSAWENYFDASYDALFAGASAQGKILVRSLLDDAEEKWVVFGYTLVSLQYGSRYLAVVLYRDVVDAAVQLKDTVDKNSISIDDIRSGTYLNVTDTYKREYMGLLLDVLFGLNCQNAHAYLAHLIASLRLDVNALTGEQLTAFEALVEKRMLLTGERQAVKSIGTFTLDAYKNYLLNGVRTKLSAYAAGTEQTDAEYDAVFAKMRAEEKIRLTFYTADNIDSTVQLTDAKNRHILYFDKHELLQSSTVTQVKASLYLTNKSKTLPEGNGYTNAFVENNYNLIYRQISVAYVDYFGMTTKDTAKGSDYVNRLVIDPLNPILPDTVQAYATYEKTPGQSVLIDIGEVNVSYASIFRSLTNFAGNGDAGESGSYLIELVDSRGTPFSVSVTVFFVDRTVRSYYTDSAYYSSEYVGGGGEYNGYYTLLKESGENRISLDVTSAATVDVDKGTYILPDKLVVNFTSYVDVIRSTVRSQVMFENIVWDMSNIKYSLSGLPITEVRMLSYRITNSDGTFSAVSLNYTARTMTVVRYSMAGTQISSVVFNGTPSYAIWNLKIDAEDGAITTAYTTDALGGDSVFATYQGEGGSEHWLTATNHSINPYFPEFPSSVKIKFGTGEVYAYESLTWSYHTGSHGQSKLTSILAGSVQQNERFIVAGFKYLSEWVWIKFMVDNVVIEQPKDEGGNNLYINGGTLYLIVSDTMTAQEQFAEFYPYLYYNFSTTGASDWRRIPLTFDYSTIRNIDTKKEGVTTGVVGALGTGSGKNIQFTVEVINPLLYATGAEGINAYVTYGMLSIAVDSNSRRIVSAGDPTDSIFGKYLYQAKRDGSGYTDFRILDTVYDIVGMEVTFYCEYRLVLEDNSRIAGGASGDRFLTFRISLPLYNYRFSDVSSLKFVKQSSTDYKWTAIPENSPDYIDAIYWTLGKPMSSTMLPKAVDIYSGTEISLHWDLSSININRASDVGYVIEGYYYGAGSQWVSKKLTVYIQKQDITEFLGSANYLTRTYDGHRYAYPLDYLSANMQFLRADGSYQNLSAASYIIEYRLKSSSELSYSESSFPLNVGVYYVRVRVEDYNVSGELIVELTINPYEIIGAPGANTGLTTAIKFVGATSDNIIHHVYDGTEKELLVAAGLPFVAVENWPQTKAEKDQLYLKEMGPGVDETMAKARAYAALYETATQAVKSYMDKLKASVKAQTGITGDTQLNARTFDEIDYALSICEVVYKITYKNANEVILETAPIEVGIYTAEFDIIESENGGNYRFDSRTGMLSVRISIEKPIVNYSLANNTLTYTGRSQNPLINGLHDGNGALPAGVAVTYEYSYYENGVFTTVVGGVRNVGSYTLTITIYGGTNYPNGSIIGANITVVKKDLHIYFDEVRGEYLSDIQDVSGALSFQGFVGTDRASDFCWAAIRADVESYYTLGRYPIYLDGFKLNSLDAYFYTNIDKENVYVINGIEYYRMTLKTALEAGSLYSYLNEDGQYEYKALIDEFNNYNVYVMKSGEYVIYADDAEVIDTAAELSTALAKLKTGDRLKLYLSPLYLDAEQTILGSYGKIVLNVNASVTIVGSYNQAREIQTYLDSVVVTQGELTLRIIGFNGKQGKDSIYIGENAGMISLVDCLMNGGGETSSRAVVTHKNFADKLYISRTVINRYNHAIVMDGGSVEFEGSTFIGNNFGIQLSTSADIYIRGCTFEEQMQTALSLQGTDFALINCTFRGNRVAIEGAAAKEEDALLQNIFDKTNGTNYKTI